jgi:hypothetical protein
VEENEIENAVATCFLEHMHQVRIDRVLAPYLSRARKEKSTRLTVLTISKRPMTRFKESGGSRPR